MSPVVLALILDTLCTIHSIHTTAHIILRGFDTSCTMNIGNAYGPALYGAPPHIILPLCEQPHLGPFAPSQPTVYVINLVSGSNQ
jgi:hypothetical protein